MNVFFFSLYLIFSLNAGHGGERCSVKNCICTVRQTEIDTYSETIKIFFKEDSTELSEQSKQKILNFISSSNRTIYISGYADQCGPEVYNYNLSNKRASAVASYIRSQGRSAKVYGIYGEKHSTGHLHGDKKVVLFYVPNKIIRMMDAYEPDVYLLDASGSAASYGYWDDIQSYDFKKGSRIIVSKVDGCDTGQYIRDVGAYGGTEIWYSYWYVLTIMRFSQTLLIVSDFEKSDPPLSQSGRQIIENLVRQKNITVYYINPKEQ